MLHIIIVMFERMARIVRRVNIDTLDLSGIVREKGFQGIEIIPLYQQIVGVFVSIMKRIDLLKNPVLDLGGRLNICAAS